MKDMNARVRRIIATVGGVLCCTLFTMSTFAELCADGVGVMSIAGRWRFALGDTTNCTDVIDLPSTTDIARKGNGRINARELEKIDPMRDDAYLTDALTRHPTRRFPYVGPATYERDVDIPAEWAGKRIELLIERTKYVSVYFDGKPIGRCETPVVPVPPSTGEPVVVKSTWVNVGVAPQYGNATLTWNLLNDKGVVCWRVTDNKFGFRSAEPKWNGVEKPVEVATPCRFGYTAPVPKKDVVLDWFVKHKRNLPGEKVELLKPGVYTLAVSVGRKDGKLEIALPLEGGIDRIYPVGKIEVVSKMRGRQFTE